MSIVPCITGAYATPVHAYIRYDTLRMYEWLRRELFRCTEYSIALICNMYLISDRHSTDRLNNGSLVLYE